MKLGGGTSLAFARRTRDPLFTDRVFVGHAIDIGAGPDPLTDEGFPLLKSVRAWDKGDGDATLMAGVADESYDVVYSSHCLEHIPAAGTALVRWWKLVRPGGHLVVVVPDLRTYERGVWPSARNADHKHPFNVRGFLQLFRHAVDTSGARNVLVRFESLDAGFEPDADRDQTADGSCECGLEIVIRKEAA